MLRCKKAWLSRRISKRKWNTSMVCSELKKPRELLNNGIKTGIILWKKKPMLIPNS